MLGKLLKYDMKALSRYLILLHAFELLLTLIGRVFVISSMDWDDPSFFSILYLMAIVLVFVCVTTATGLILGIHFYRNLFSAQGYLTWTLPATSSQHLISKSIAGFIWTVLDILILFGCMILLFSSTFYQYPEALAEFQDVMGMSMESFAGIALVVSMIGCLYSPLSIYASITIGQLFSSHRVLAAVIIYGALYMVLQLLTSVIMFAAGGMLGFLTRIESSDPAFISSYFSAQYTRTMIISGVMSVILALVLYIVSQVIMKKKINLI